MEKNENEILNVIKCKGCVYRSKYNLGCLFDEVKLKDPENTGEMKHFRRIKFGDESKRNKIKSDYCLACGVTLRIATERFFHHVMCPYEECPLCGNRLITEKCECKPSQGPSYSIKLPDKRKSS